MLTKSEQEGQTGSVNLAGDSENACAEDGGEHTALAGDLCLVEELTDPRCPSLLLPLFMSQ